MTSLFATMLEAEKAFKLKVEEGIRAAEEEPGYLDNGALNRDLLLTREQEKLQAHQVFSRRERSRKAITIFTMMEHLFPSLPQPDAFDEQPDPHVAQEVWKHLTGLVWRDTQARGPLQTKVTENLGDGHFVLRFEPGQGTLRKVYLTTDASCITEDYFGARRQAARRVFEAQVKDHVEASKLQPGKALRFAKDFEVDMTQALKGAVERVMIAAQAADAEYRAAAETEAPDAGSDEADTGADES